MTPHPYASAAYAGTLRHVGRPFEVAPWGTHVILRAIPGHCGLFDAAGPYPLLPLRRDADIPAGLDVLRKAGAVSVVLVADPLTGPPVANLARHFPLAVPFKTHHLMDRAAGPIPFSPHHREFVRRGERRTRVARVCLAEPRWLEAWTTLYAALVARRGITGPAAFPPASAAALARLPDDALATFAALSPDGAILAMQHWIRHDGVACSHLAAANEAGHRASANYALHAAALRALTDCRVLDLGAGAGPDDDPADGLARFKAGFANATATAHLLGAVLDPATYARLRAPPGTAFFPAYRAPSRPAVTTDVR